MPDRGCAYTGFVDSFFAIYVAAPDTRPARTPMAMRTPQSASRHGTSAHTQATAHAAAPRGAAKIAHVYTVYRRPRPPAKAVSLHSLHVLLVQDHPWNMYATLKKRVTSNDTP